jgi:hypothetical protein
MPDSMLVYEVFYLINQAKSMKKIQILDIKLTKKEQLIADRLSTKESGRIIGGIIGEGQLPPDVWCA